jgi:hypothetical protein
MHAAMPRVFSLLPCLINLFVHFELVDGVSTLQKLNRIRQLLVQLALELLGRAHRRRLPSSSTALAIEFEDAPWLGLAQHARRGSRVLECAAQSTTRRLLLRRHPRTVGTRSLTICESN